MFQKVEKVLMLGQLDSPLSANIGTMSGRCLQTESSSQSVIFVVGDEVRAPHQLETLNTTL